VTREEARRALITACRVAGAELDLTEARNGLILRLIGHCLIWDERAGDDLQVVQGNGYGPLLDETFHEQIERLARHLSDTITDKPPHSSALSILRLSKQRSLTR
jgi:hypothetical protein